jgi:hypothetical protein
MYDLCMFIRYLVSITQFLKDTQFGLDNWGKCGNLFKMWKFISDMGTLVASLAGSE